MWFQAHFMPLGAACCLCHTFTKTEEKPWQMGEIKQRKTQFIQRVEHDIYLLYPLNLSFWTEVLHKLFVTLQMFFLPLNQNASSDTASSECSTETPVLCQQGHAGPMIIILQCLSDDITQTIYPFIWSMNRLYRGGHPLCPWFNGNISW